MPKAKIEQPSENELIAYYLYLLLGGREQKLLQNILSLKNNRGELALIEDKHTACLANLFSLLYQYPPDPQIKETDEIIKIIDLVLKDCIPLCLDVRRQNQ
ncbi:MAG: hypothetical protein K2Q33_01865 [Gammaproteobacteria bacterium]|nr:hypothetical protein [Gammaproteobacteria bacterium]